MEVVPVRFGTSADYQAWAGGALASRQHRSLCFVGGGGMSRDHHGQVPGMFEKVPAGYKGDARYIVGLLQGVLRAVRSGVADEATYADEHGEPNEQDLVRMFSMGPEQIRILANRIGYETGLVELEKNQPGGLQHEIEDGRLPAWSASGFTCWEEATQYQWMGVTVMAAVVTEPTSVQALAESTGVVRAEAIEVVKSLWSLACGMPDRSMA